MFISLATMQKKIWQTTFLAEEKKDCQLSQIAKGSRRRVAKSWLDVIVPRKTISFSPFYLSSTHELERPTYAIPPSIKYTHAFLLRYLWIFFPCRVNVRFILAGLGVCVNRVIQIFIKSESPKQTFGSLQSVIYLKNSETFVIKNFYLHRS